MSDYIIEVNNLTKKFNIKKNKTNSLKEIFINIFQKKAAQNFFALKDISFSVKKGEFIGIVGKNGSGKSTLLKIISNIYLPTSGNIKVNGKISPFLELGIGFNPELSGYDNIYLNGIVLGLTRKKIDQIIDQIIDFSEIRPFIYEKIKNYSSGMKARLAFSVLIHTPNEILLMDEIFAVGDQQFKKKCQAEFKKILNENRTIIFVSHSTNDILEYADKVLILEKGKQVQFDETQKTIKLFNEMLKQ